MNDKEFEEPSNRVDIARKAILNDLKSRRKSGDKSVLPMNPDDAHRWYKPQDNYFVGDGIMDCPIMCGGKLQYSRPGHNGHVHGRCSTAGCVAWME